MTGEVGERIRALRSARGMSQADLAGAVGVSNSYLSHIEAGRRPVSPTLLAQVAKALAVDLAQLEGGIPPDAKEELNLRLRFAELSLRSGDWELAQREFSAVLESGRSLPLQPLVEEAMWGKARADEATGQLERAIEGYEWLIGRSTESSAVAAAAVFVALIRAYSECGDLSRAIDIGERAVSALDADEVAAEVGLEVELVSTLAGCYVERGDLTRAQGLITRALNRAEADGSPRARAAAAWNAAIIAEARHDIAAARKQADRALALYSEVDNARAVGLLRVVSAGLRLRQEHPDPRWAFRELAQAIQELKEVGTRVDLAYAGTEQARAHLLAGEPKRAVEAGRKALDDLSEGDRLQRGRTLIVLGQAAAAQGAEREALTAYREAAELLLAATASRQAAAAWRELGEAYVAQGRANEAIEALRRASDLAGATYHPVRVALDAAAGQALG
jgi:transcriptional regulator with XRE-family HTH domain